MNAILKNLLLLVGAAVVALAAAVLLADHGIRAVEHVSIYPATLLGGLVVAYCVQSLSVARLKELGLILVGVAAIGAAVHFVVPAFATLTVLSYVLSGVLVSAVVRG